MRDGLVLVQNDARRVGEQHRSRHALHVHEERVGHPQPGDDGSVQLDFAGVVCGRGQQSEVSPLLENRSSLNAHALKSAGRLI